MRLLAIALLAAACGGKSPAGEVPVSTPVPHEPAEPPEIVDDEPAPPEKPATPIADAYREVASKIISKARADRTSWERLAYLTDRIGHRLSGTRQLEQAVSWTKETLIADGHDVTVDPVLVPHWVRGAESARIVTPVERPLTILGLGGTVGTRKGGVRGKVVVVHSWEELEAKKAEVAGKIVLFDVAMPTWTEKEGSGYGRIAPYRWAGPSAAAKHGAIAVLMRSVTAHSLRTPHTGSMGYDDKLPKIPAAAVTVEDSEQIARLAAAGDVTVQLDLGARMLPDAPSHNVIAEIKGREKPDEIVVIGAHLDSWDVGQGAHDDGAGCIHVMHALTTLRQLGLQPRRTIRVVLFTNEENGTKGSQGYFAAHGNERHVAALESDSGGFAPRGLDVQFAGEARDAVIAQLADLATLLPATGLVEVTPSEHSGTDIGPLTRAGVLGLGFRTEGSKYFDIHHTPADTLDKVDPQHLADGVAAVAVIAYVLADLPTEVAPGLVPAAAKPAEQASGR